MQHVGDIRTDSVVEKHDIRQGAGRDVRAAKRDHFSNRAVGKRTEYLLISATCEHVLDIIWIGHAMFNSGEDSDGSEQVFRLKAVRYALGVGEHWDDKQLGISRADNAGFHQGKYVQDLIWRRCEHELSGHVAVLRT